MSSNRKGRAEVLCPVSGQSPGEELLNVIFHGLGLLAGIAGTAVLVVLASLGGSPWTIVGVSVFGGALVLLYGISTGYHTAWNLRWKRALQVADHMAIFALIAGSYTPFALGPLRGAWGWSLLGVIWGLALAGTGLKLWFGSRYPLLSTGAYLVMGWLVVIALGPLTEALNVGSITLLVLGGVAYTVGAVFYLWDEKVPYFHPVFHALVLVGSTCHFLVVLGYVRHAA